MIKKDILYLKLYTTGYDSNDAEKPYFVIFRLTNICNSSIYEYLIFSFRTFDDMINEIDSLSKALDLKPGKTNTVETKVIMEYEDNLPSKDFVKFYITPKSPSWPAQQITCKFVKSTDYSDCIFYSLIEFN